MHDTKSEQEQDRMELATPEEGSNTKDTLAWPTHD